jgi:hypothetical protein
MAGYQRRETVVVVERPDDFFGAVIKAALKSPAAIKKRFLRRSMPANFFLDADVTEY